jgi:hypothetical protein
MAINFRFLIVLLAIAMLTSLSIPPVKADWFHDDVKSRIAASLLSQNMSALK